MPISTILQPPKKKAKRKAKILKKRQKIIPVLLPLPSPLPSPLPLQSPSLLLLATPVKPISIDKVNKGEDKNIKELIEVEDKDIRLLLPLPLLHIYFTSVQKVVIGSRKESLPSIRLAIFNTKSIYYFKLDKWQNKTILYLLPRKFKITQL